MPNKATSAVLGACLLTATACSSTAPDTAATTAVTTSATVPASTSAPSGDPASSTASSLLTAMVLDAGRYVVNYDGTAPQLEITLPAGYVKYSDVAVRNSEQGYIGMFDIDNVYTDSCQYVDTAVAIGPTVDDLVAAVSAQRNTQVTAPQPVELDGHTGTQITISTPSGLDLKTCWGGRRAAWEAEGGVPSGTTAEGAVSLWIFDVDGTRVVISWGSDLPMSEAARAEMRTAVESIRFV